MVSERAFNKRNPCTCHLQTASAVLEDGTWDWDLGRLRNFLSFLATWSALCCVLRFPFLDRRTSWSPRPPRAYQISNQEFDLGRLISTENKVCKSFYLLFCTIIEFESFVILCFQLISKLATPRACTV